MIFQKHLSERIVRSLVQAVDEKPESKHLFHRVRNLTSILDESDIKLDHKNFLILNDFGNDQNNPKPELIEKICTNFGIDRFFDQISNSDLDVAFEDGRTEIQQLTERLIQHLTEGTRKYPYSLNPSLFNIALEGKPNLKKQSARSIWQAFLDELNKERHLIAHGTSVNNDSSPEEITRNMNKLRVLQYSFLLLICHKCMSNISTTNLEV